MFTQRRSTRTLPRGNDSQWPCDCMYCMRAAFVVITTRVHNRAASQLVVVSTVAAWLAVGHSMCAAVVVSACQVRATTANAAYAMTMIRSQCTIAGRDERGTWPLVAATQLHMGEADVVGRGFFASACCAFAATTKRSWWCRRCAARDNRTPRFLPFTSRFSPSWSCPRHGFAMRNRRKCQRPNCRWLLVVA